MKKYIAPATVVCDMQTVEMIAMSLNNEVSTYGSLVRGQEDWDDEDEL